MNNQRLIAVIMILLLVISAWGQNQKKKEKRFNIAIGIKCKDTSVSDKSDAQNGNNSETSLAGIGSMGGGANNPSEPTYNFNIGLLSNVARLHGVQFGALSSIVDGEMRGVNVAGILAYANGDVKGVQISSLANITKGHVRGVQLCGSVNIARRLHGAQVGIYNFVDELEGTQIGIINVARHHPKGWQVGIINYTQDTIAHKIGLVNVNPKTNIDVLVYAGNTSIFNIAVRFRNRSTYNILGVGTHYFGLDDKFSGALSYRIGQYFHLSPRWTISGDVGYYHIESFEENSKNKPKRLYSLQGHVNIDYQINKSLGAFVSTGYGNTRYYGSHELYKQQFIIQGGISVRYNKHKERVKANKESAR